MIKKIIIFLTATSIISCEGLFMEPDPIDDPEINFEILWNDYDRYYSYFNFKGVDWDSIYEVYRPHVTANTTPGELFDIFKPMILSLKDGHSDLISPFGRIDYEFDKGIPANIISILSYATFKNASEPIVYGELNNTNLGYIRIISFGMGTNDDYRVIDQVLAKFKDKDGIIIDVRNNGGGSDSKSGIVASRFYDQRRLYRRVKYRNGPEHDDFTDWIDSYQDPDGPFQYKKNIAVLTNRKVFSSSEDFVLAMGELPYVTIIGDTTGGGAGNPISRELPNGWLFRVSTWFQVDARNVSTEGRGIYPDIPVWITKEDSAANKDTILDTAIQLLESQ